MNVVTVVSSACRRARSAGATRSTNGASAARRTSTGARRRTSMRATSSPTATTRPTTRSDPNAHASPVSPRCMQSRTTSARRGRAPTVRARRATTRSSSARHSARTAAAPSVHVVGHRVRFEQIARRSAPPASPLKARHYRDADALAGRRSPSSWRCSSAAGSPRSRCERHARRRRPASRPTTAITDQHRQRRRPTRTACSTCTSSTGRSTSRPGQNVIETNKYRIPQPKEDGWIVGFKPNLQLPNGKVPAGRRAAPAPRRVGGRQPAATPTFRCSPSASSPPARRRPRSSCPRRLRLPRTARPTPGTSTT